MVWPEAIFWLLTKHGRKSLKGPTYHVLYYPPWLSGCFTLSFSFSLPLTDQVVFALWGCRCVAPLQSNRCQLCVSAQLPPQMEDEFCPGTKYLIPVSLCPCPGSSSLGPRNATLAFWATSVATWSWPEPHQEPWGPSGSPDVHKGKPMNFVTSGQIIPNSEETLKNISKVSDPIYELV